METGRLELRDRALIGTSAPLNISGNAGNLEVTADTIVIQGARDSSNPFSSGNITGFSTATVGNGKGGDLHLTAESIQMTDYGFISSVSVGAGDAGNVQIDAGSLRLTDGSLIAASTFGSGHGGNIEVEAKEVTVAGAGRFLSIDPLKGGPGMSGVASIALGGGTAGNVRIDADSLRILDGATLNTRTGGPGNGGNIEVSATSVLVSGVNLSLKESLSSIPDLNPGLISRAGRAGITTGSIRFNLEDAATGHAGNVRITAGDLQVNAGGVISSATTTTGSGGAIEVVADRVTLAGDALISAESALSTNAGKAGDISITAQGVKHEGSSSDPTRWVILGGSRIAANAFEGKGGNIRITAGVFLADPVSIVSASSSKGINGEVDIRSPITNLSGSLTPLPRDFLSAAALLRQRCVERMRDRTASSLVIRQHDGLPSEPDGLLPSPLYRKEKR